MEEKDYWMGFSVFSGVGPVTFQQLVHRFGSAKVAWGASVGDLQEVLKEKKTKDFVTFRETFDFTAYKKRLEKTKVSIITLEDPTYPILLKQTPKPPFVLYLKGNKKAIEQLSNRTIAVVGTRKITQYGRDVTEMFTESLVHAGFTIVSGLAMGVDAVAHQTTLDNGGKTIAVLGCGVDCCYPVENEKLYDDILASGGAIISEVPLGMSATIGTFPARNRIVAGMSQGVLVTEGTADSGALITANFGIEYGRKVFAVPGPITSQLSKGPYKLIEKGAKLVTKPEDILQEFQISNNKFPISNKNKVSGGTPEEQEILDLLENEALNFDEIVRRVNLDSGKVASMVSMMEIKGLIKSNANGGFSITN
jgi:DNA processing protein